MKRIFKIRLRHIAAFKMRCLFAALIVVVGEQGNAQTILTKEERQFAIKYLQDTKQEFVKATEGLTPEQATFKSKNSKWSILECAEHIVLAEQSLFAVIKTQLQIPFDPLKRKEIRMTEKKIITRLTFRLFKAKAPENITPSGKYTDLETARKAFMLQRDSTINYTDTTQQALHEHFWQHRATGTIDLYQTIILLSAHCKRHILQMEEVKKRRQFPKALRIP
jgi:DinB superfamily